MADVISLMVIIIMHTIIYHVLVHLGSFDTIAFVIKLCNVFCNEEKQLSIFRVRF